MCTFIGINSERDRIGEVMSFFCLDFPYLHMPFFRDISCIYKINRLLKNGG